MLFCLAEDHVCFELKIIGMQFLELFHNQSPHFYHIDVCGSQWLYPSKKRVQREHVYGVCVCLYFRMCGVFRYSTFSAFRTK